MHAFGTLGTIIGRVKGDNDSIVPWQERVVVIESKRARGAQEADIVECMDGMRFTKGLIWWLVLLGGDRIACRICTGSRAMAQNRCSEQIMRTLHRERLTNIDRFAAIPERIV
jgi:hypothetical protein